ncbi:S24 family peptidase [Porcipelethomonas ammoniilytica]|uniref:S24 family peptidase n=1 Tax=Porcipelethomonas ammoniilytica TaxID=2981722 RepID=UPI0011CA6F65|nr:S24 family peptidase [Porcipelethomonas ammoniilytica]MCU6720711.1 S24 family peptidase [Porcipelethomonas ammoniilytica]
MCVFNASSIIFLAVRISGDSMEPTYCDGDILLVEGLPYINISDIGVFVVNGDGYVKEYGGDRVKEVRKMEKIATLLISSYLAWLIADIKCKIHLKRIDRMNNEFMDKLRKVHDEFFYNINQKGKP